MQRTRAIIAILAFSLAVHALFPAPALRAELIEYFLIYYPSISPNGDGTRESSPVKLGISEECNLVSLTLEDAIGTLVLDTLLHLEDVPAGTYSAEWAGTDSLGAVLEEGEYRLHLLASRGSISEDDYRLVIVDTTAPRASIDRIEPSIYTPDLPGTAERVLIHMKITDSGPGDSLRMETLHPDSTLEELQIDFVGDGPYTVEWSADSDAEDGLYMVLLSMGDEAGNSSTDQGYIDVDTGEPYLAFTDTFPTPAREVPPYVEGSCYDRNGVEEPVLIWNEGSPFPADSTWWDADTLFWRFGIMDSVSSGGLFKDGTYTIGILCSDPFGHEAEAEMTFTLDLTAPDAPSLDEPPPAVLEPVLSLTGLVDVEDTDSIFVYRAAGADTSITAAEIGSPTFRIDIELVEGPNEIWAFAADGLGSISEPSNVVSVIFERAVRFVYPEAFREPGSVEIFTGDEAREVEIRIFTLDGERVRIMHARGPATRFDFFWNLLNDDGEEVRNGPYLLVIITHYDGSESVDRSFIAVVR